MYVCMYVCMYVYIWEIVCYEISFTVLGGSLSASSKNLEVPKDGSLFNPAISGSGYYCSYVCM